MRYVLAALWVLARILFYIGLSLLAVVPVYFLTVIIFTAF